MLRSKNTLDGGARRCERSGARLIGRRPREGGVGGGAGGGRMEKSHHNRSRRLDGKAGRQPAKTEAGGRDTRPSDDRNALVARRAETARLK